MSISAFYRSARGVWICVCVSSSFIYSSGIQSRGVLSTVISLPSSVSGFGSCMYSQR